MVNEGGGNATVTGLRCTAVGVGTNGFGGNGIGNYVSTTVIKDSVFDVGGYIFDNNSSIYVVNSQLKGYGLYGMYATSPKCLGTYNENYDPIICQ